MLTNQTQDKPVIYKKETCKLIIKKLHIAQLHCEESKTLIKNDMADFFDSNIGVELFNNLDEIIEKLDNYEFFLKQMLDDNIELIRD